jgi:hypothetical protein
MFIGKKAQETFGILFPVPQAWGPVQAILYPTFLGSQFFDSVPNKILKKKSWFQNVYILKINI